jgi:hypothetical protein
MSIKAGRVVVDPLRLCSKKELVGGCNTTSVAYDGADL